MRPPPLALDENCEPALDETLLSHLIRKLNPPLLIRIVTETYPLRAQNIPHFIHLDHQFLHPDLSNAGPNRVQAVTILRENNHIAVQSIVYSCKEALSCLCLAQMSERKI